MSGPDVQASLRVPQSQWPPRAAHAGIDHRQVDSHRHVLQRIAQDERSLQDALGRDPVGDVDDLRLRRDALDHPVAGPHEVVLQSEVGQERDDHDGGTIRRTAPTRPSRSCVSASATTSTPATARGLGADRDRGSRRSEGRVRPRGRWGREHDEIDVGERGRDEAPSCGRAGRNRPRARLRAGGALPPRRRTGRGRPVAAARPAVPPGSRRAGRGRRRGAPRRCRDRSPRSA